MRLYITPLISIGCMTADIAASNSRCGPMVLGVDRRLGVH
jgi:hypothetical protein